MLEGHQGTVRALAYTPDGCYIISRGYDETITFWNTTSGFEGRRFQGDLHWVHLLGYVPTGKP